jgi:hypothetical protein
MFFKGNVATRTTRNQRTFFIEKKSFEPQKKRLTDHPQLGFEPELKPYFDKRDNTD